MFRPETRFLAPLLVAFLFLGAGGDASQPDGPLDWTVGTWKGTRRDFGEHSEAPLAILVAEMPDRLGEIERLEVETGGDPYVGFTVCTPDPANERWMRIYTNDVRAKLARLVANPEGDRVVWVSVTAKPPRGSRLVSERLGPDRWRRTQQVSEDGGVTWRDVFVDELARMKPDSP